MLNNYGNNAASGNRNASGFQEGNNGQMNAQLQPESQPPNYESNTMQAAQSQNQMQNQGIGGSQ